MSKQKEDLNVRKEVRERYGKLAAEFEPQSSCCGSSVEQERCSPSVELYETEDVRQLPEDVTGMSLGCGDPVTLAALEPGQVVLDLGSGGGIDCFLAAQRVGETGFVIGVDMTAEMLDRARKNQAKMGVENVDFRSGEIEHLPVENEVADVIISNCVINLSPDKPQVFKEAFRVLKPGGKLAVSDIMTESPFPETMIENMDSWAACVSGALTEADYISAIKAAGFVDVNVEKVYIEPDTSQVEAELEAAGLSDKIAEVAAGKSAVVKTEDSIQVIPVDKFGGKESIPRVFSGKVTAKKPE